jgi:tubby-related protein 1
MLFVVERDRGGFARLAPTFRLYRESSVKGQPREFIMAAKKKIVNRTSYYLVSMDPNPDDRGSGSVVGKIRGNAVGSEYSIVDGGLTPGQTTAPSLLRREHGLIQFDYLQSGPSKISVFIPTVSLSGQVREWQSQQESDGIDREVVAKRQNGLMRLMNIQPKWDSVHGGHVLNFHGRVTESSVKNFQMQVVPLSGHEPSIANHVSLQFGRTGKNSFTMDASWPLSPFQAFAICTACIDGKIADRIGYAFLRKLGGATRDTPGGEGGWEDDPPSV